MIASPLNEPAVHMDDPMETMLGATARLRDSGFTTNLSAAPLGRLHCATCAATVDAADSTVVEIIRFEGESNPDDEEILVALISRCGHRGLFSCAYGQAASVDATDVLRALPSPTPPRADDDQVPSTRVPPK
jgi:hypothetical protein